MVLTPARRNVMVLAVCQAVAMTSISMMATVSALTGQMLASDKALATLPIALQQLAVMLTTFPASYLMRHFGRRAGFSVGALIGMLGGSLQCYAVFRSDFALFCLGNALVGVANGFALFFRFAAAETADLDFKSKAISLVMAGGVIAALAGPELAKWAHDWFQPVQFAGAFVAIALLQALNCLLVQFVRIPRPSAAERRLPGRPLGTIMRQPVFIVAALGGMVGYGSMSLVMTATPLAMVGCGFAFGTAATIIQWHVLGMFVPSFFTGHLIAHFGAPRIMLIGTACLLACAAINLAGIQLWNFWAALVLLGIGWNFLYIGASSLLIEAYRSEERAKTQALNDFLVFSLVTTASFASGGLNHRFGWSAVNLGVILPVLLAAGALYWLLQHRRAVPA
jgi:MFS family permease